MVTDFVPFPKISRLFRDMVITEKIDGTNASVWIEQVGVTEAVIANIVPGNLVDDRVATVDVNGIRYSVCAGSRKRFLGIGGTKDNFAFASWVAAHADELALGLGEGVHHGEWWGKGIQRGYGLSEKRFSLLNPGRWFNYDWPEHDDTAPDGMERAPECCHVVPVLRQGVFNLDEVKIALATLRVHGSKAAPGFMDPEGVVVYHKHSGQLFKVTIGDDGHKGAAP